MGTFKIINQSGNDESTTVCTDFSILDPLCTLDKVFTVKEGDSLSLHYDFGYDLQVTPNTKVHFVLVDQNVDAKISPAGADKMNNQGWCNPYLADILSPGTFRLYAYDEYYNKATASIYLTVEAKAPTCLKEGEIDVPYVGLGCCPGLVADPLNWNKCTLIVPDGGNDGGNGSAMIDISRLSNGNYGFSINGIWELDNVSKDTIIARLKSSYCATDAQIVYAFSHLDTRVSVGGGCVPVPCQPPNGVQRKCNDATTIAVWNQVTCSYDTASCGTGKHCSNGNCIVDSTGCIPTTRKCVTPLNGKDTDGCTEHVNTACNPPAAKKYKCISGACKEDATGTYTTSTCNGACTPSAGSSSGTTVALLIVAGIAAAIILMKKEA